MFHRAFVGRQPIHRPDGSVAAYELLFRASAESRKASSRGDAATADVITRAFTDFGLQRLVGELPAFLNITHAFVEGRRALPFGPTGVVLELLEDITVDAGMIAGMGRLRDAGYTLALDDWIAGSARDALLPLVDYVKIDIRDVPPADLPDAAREARRYGAKLVIECVETADQYAAALVAGFDLVQGWYFSAAETLSVGTLEPDRLNSLTLLQKLADPDASVESIVDAVVHDAGLSFRVLRAANSAAVGARSKVRSVRDAMVLVGLERLRAWVLLALMDDGLELSQDDSTALLIRARFAELLGARLGVRREEAFAVGLLSGVAQLFDSPVAEVAANMSLAEDLRAALITGEGPLGQVLAGVEAHASDDDAVLEAMHVAPTDVATDAMESVAWAVSVSVATSSAAA